MAKRTYPLSRVYQLLEPGPVVMLTTAHRGKANIMTQSWHTMMEFEPPLVGCVIGAQSHSFDALRKTGECVLNIPSAELAKQVVGVGNCSGNKVDKFAATRRELVRRLPAMSRPNTYDCRNRSTSSTRMRDPSSRMVTPDRLPSLSACM